MKHLSLLGCDFFKIVVSVILVLSFGSFIVVKHKVRILPFKSVSSNSISKEYEYMELTVKLNLWNSTPTKLLNLSLKIEQRRNTLLNETQTFLKCSKFNKTDIFAEKTFVNIITENDPSLIEETDLSITLATFFNSNIELYKFYVLINPGLKAYKIKANTNITLIRLPHLDVLPTYTGHKHDSVHAYPLPQMPPSQQYRLKEISLSFDQPNKTFRSNKTYYANFVPFSGFYTIISNASIWKQIGLIISCGTGFYATGCGYGCSADIPEQCMRDFHDDIESNVRPLSYTSIHIEKAIVCSYILYPVGFYHLIHSDFARIMIAYDLLLADPNIFILMKRNKYKHIYIDLFEIFGISTKRIYWLDDHIHYTVTYLILPSGFTCLITPLSLLNLLHRRTLMLINKDNRKEIQPFRDQLFEEDYSKIYPIISRPNNSEQHSQEINRFKIVRDGHVIVIVRDNGTYRSIQNHEDFMISLYGHLKRYSIEVVQFFANISLIDAIKLFHTSRAVIGPHGAGLTFLAFMRAGTAVLEILPDDDSKAYIPCYWNIAIARQIKYFSMLVPNSKYYEKPMKLNITIAMELVHEMMRERLNDV
ncbi:unnamed protein product [Didymodactylos carnosus]|uniref:Glycosyltransferase 61 catalytic domain-containing protein n=1 Tax=Didymodactylos carnosus TaxID=1234261 RepID=A0A815ECY8_9BILA|nr:unnamed protein product [Didymodactylos carnosus]CAF4144317.1 unnamed protein product [Didymodactylos carnosus]